MTFGERVRERRGELKMTRAALAAQLGVTVSAVSNYETGVSFPKEEILLRLFDSLRVDPNTLFQDSYQDGQLILTGAERQLLEDLRTLPPTSRVAVRAMVDALCACQEEAETFSLSPADFRQIPLYRTPAAAGYTSPAFGEDFDYIPVTARCLRGRNLPSGFRGIPCGLTLRTAPSLTSTGTPCKTGTWASSAWTAISSASSITRTPPAPSSSSP